MYVEIWQKEEYTEAEDRLYLCRLSVFTIYIKKKYVNTVSDPGRLPQLEEVSWIYTNILLENCWLCIQNNWLKLRHIISFKALKYDIIFQTDVFVISWDHFSEK